MSAAVLVLPPRAQARCNTCRNPIPEKRLEAMPGTKICVSCLSAKGDVRVVRRFDEQLASGETVQSYYTDDPYIEQQLRHANLKSAAALDEFGHLDACAVITGCDLATLVYEQGVENQRELDEAKES